MTTKNRRSDFGIYGLNFRSWVIYVIAMYVVFFGVVVVLPEVLDIPLAGRTALAATVVVLSILVLTFVHNTQNRRDGEDTLPEAMQKLANRWLS